MFFRKLRFIFVLIFTILASISWCKVNIKVYTGNSPRINAADATDDFLIFSKNSEIFALDHISRKIKKIPNKSKSEIFSISEIRCYEDKNVCLVTGNDEIEAYELDNGRITLISRYIFKQENKIKKTFLKISPISKSDYFLSCGTIKQGVMRWNFGEFRKFAKMTFEEEFIPNFLSPSSLITPRNTLFGLLTLRTWNKLILIDFTRMKEIRKIKHCRGIIGYFDLQPEKNLIVMGFELKMSLISFKNGKKMKNIFSDYYVQSLRTFPQSFLFVIATGDFVRVYDFLKNDPDPKSYVFSYKTNLDGVYGVFLNEKSRQIFFYRKGVLKGIEILEPKQDTQCHPSCQGCSEGFSSYACISCKQTKNSTLVKVRKDEKMIPKKKNSLFHGKCKTENSKKIFFGKVENFQKIEWSKSKEGAFISSLTFFQVLILAGAISGIVLILSIFSSIIEFLYEKCKKKTNENIEENNKEILAGIEEDDKNDDKKVEEKNYFDENESRKPPISEIECSVVLNRMNGRETARSFGGINDATLFTGRSNFGLSEELGKAKLFQVKKRVLD